MKKFLTIAFAAAVVFAVSVTTSKAQVYAFQSIALPTTLTAGTTNLASAPVIGALKQRQIAFSATLTATATATNFYTLYPSVDGVNFDSTKSVVFIGVTTGAANTYTTNFDTGGYGFYKLFSITTACAGTVTNGAHSYSVKQSAP